MRQNRENWSWKTKIEFWAPTLYRHTDRRTDANDCIYMPPFWSYIHPLSPKIVQKWLKWFQNEDKHKVPSSMRAKQHVSPWPREFAEVSYLVLSIIFVYIHVSFSKWKALCNTNIYSEHQNLWTRYIFNFLLRLMFWSPDERAPPSRKKVPILWNDLDYENPKI